MKAPRNREEYLVWPPMAGIAVIVVAPTISETLDIFHSSIPALEGASAKAVYLFSGGMGVGLSLRLHGKYWLGFGWMAFLCYLMLQGLRLVPGTAVPRYSFALTGSLVVLFVTLSVFLYGKRVTIHSDTESDQE